jgi:hypothetical protein
MNKPNPDRPETSSERRKAIRFPVVIPIKAKWLDPKGNSVQEAGQANEVNASGGLLEMANHPGVGSTMELTNEVTGETLQARVVGLRRGKKGDAFGVAVELLRSNEGFWGVNFRLRKTSAELVKIEQTIRSGGIAPSILMEFRDAVDYVRRTAWAVQEWQERQILRRDPQTVLPLITSERIRRATQLSKAITTDLASHEVTRETAGIDELYRAVQGLHEQVSDLFRKP